MEITKTIQILKSTIGNPASRRLLSGFGFCENCGKNRLDKMNLHLLVIVQNKRTIVEIICLS